MVFIIIIITIKILASNNPQLRALLTSLNSFSGIPLPSLGLILDFLLFNLYTSGFHGPSDVSSHENANDIQAYLRGPAASASSMVEHIIEASDALDRWQSSNCLLLNQDKTQHIWLGNCAQLSEIDSDSFRLRFPKCALLILYS